MREEEQAGKHNSISGSRLFKERRTHCNTKLICVFVGLGDPRAGPLQVYLGFPLRGNYML